MMPEMRRGADRHPVSGQRAGQVLALPRVWLDFGELDQVVTEDAGLFGSVRRIFR